MLRALSIAASLILTSCAGGAASRAYVAPESDAPPPVEVGAHLPETTSSTAAPLAGLALSIDPVVASPEEPDSRPETPVAEDPTTGGEAQPDSPWAFYRDGYDADADGQIARAEYTRSDLAFTRLDVNGDGVLSVEDFAPRWDNVPRVPERAKFTYGAGGPRFGEPAPGFRLKSTTGEEIALEQFRGKKPVVLVFGSFT